VGCGLWAASSTTQGLRQYMCCAAEHALGMWPVVAWAGRRMRMSVGGLDARQQLEPSCKKAAGSIYRGKTAKKRRAASPHSPH
jgi:hypothetical protein